MDHRPFLIPKNFDKSKSFIGGFTMLDLLPPFIVGVVGALILMVLVSNNLITLSSMVTIITITAIPIVIYIILLLPFKKTKLKIKRYITDWIKFITQSQFYFRKNTFDLIPDRELPNESDINN